MPRKPSERPARETPRSVKPRNKSTTVRPIIAVGVDSVYFERVQRTVPRDVLAAMLRREPSSIIITLNALQLLKELDAVFARDPRWQFQVKPLEREVFRPHEEKRRRQRTFQQLIVPTYFGWRDANRNTLYHYPIEPLTFANRTLDNLTNTGTDTQRLYEVATDIRTFCSVNGIDIKPTGGGLSGQLLRDKRFYPVSRRKVPRATNELAREQLPGNHYELRAETERKVAATYIDQSAAHHNAARTITFPHPDRLFARGSFRTLTDKPMPGGSRFLDGSWHGLLYVRLHAPHQARHAWVPPQLRQAGSHLAYVFTNELDFLRECGARIEYVVAAWVADTADEGLNRYALWALNEIARADDARKRWMKPALLSAYGILAARAKRIEFGYRLAKNGEPIEYRTPYGPLPAMRVQTQREVEPSTVNVIHRGMIEAETRKVSLQLARELQAAGCDVLSIYADALFVASDHPLPLLPPPWRISDELNDLRFFNATSFTSDRLERLPGIPREARLDLAAEKAMKHDARRPFRRRRQRV